MELEAILHNKGYCEVPLTKNAVGHLLVRVLINEVEGLFILDTGAGSTVIELNHADRFSLELQKENTSFDGAGAGGQGLEVIPSTGNKLQIGKYVMEDATICVMSLFQHMDLVFEKAGVQEELSGVLGADILLAAGALIDYKGLTLFLLPGDIAE